MFASILNTQTQKTASCICALCLFDEWISTAKAALLGTIQPPGFLFYSSRHIFIRSSWELK